jgi:hypothetical protein
MPKDTYKEVFFVHIMTIFEPPRTYGPFDSQAAATQWAGQHVAMGLQWYVSTGEVVTPDKPPVKPPVKK